MLVQLRQNRLESFSLQRILRIPVRVLVHSGALWEAILQHPSPSNIEPKKGEQSGQQADKRMPREVDSTVSYPLPALSLHLIQELFIALGSFHLAEEELHRLN